MTNTVRVPLRSPRKWRASRVLLAQSPKYKSFCRPDMQLRPKARSQRLRREGAFLHVTAVMAMTLHLHHAHALLLAHRGRGWRVLHSGIGAGSRSGLCVLRLRAADGEKRAKTSRSQANHQFLHSKILRVELNLQRR